MTEEGIYRSPADNGDFPHVQIESPYAGDVERNVNYARAALRDSLLRKEAPFASHLLYTQAFNDGIPEEREVGIRAALKFAERADLIAVYCDFGVSSGMVSAIERARVKSIPVEWRALDAYRGMGRTHRMLTDALAATLQRKTLVIAPSVAIAKEWQRRYAWISPLVMFSHPEEQEALRGRTFSDVYVDHHAWASKGTDVYTLLRESGLLGRVRNP